MRWTKNGLTQLRICVLPFASQSAKGDRMRGGLFESNAACSWRLGMLSRALILAAVTVVLGCFAAIPADAQNLEAGKSPGQIFSSTCSLCHKSPRGLLKSCCARIAAGVLAATLYDQHRYGVRHERLRYVQRSCQRAGRRWNLTRQGQEAKSGPRSSARARTGAGGSGAGAGRQGAQAASTRGKTS